MKTKNTKKVAFIGLSIALAMILSFVESQIPSIVPIYGQYGIKIGLPNLVMVFLLYRVGWKETVMVSIIRILLMAMLFPNAFAFVLSISGAILSLAVMILLKKTNLFSCITISIAGGAFHNIGQITAACFLTETAQIAYYLPVLLISGTLAGTLIGVVSGLLVKRLDKFKF